MNTITLRDGLSTVSTDGRTMKIVKNLVVLMVAMLLLVAHGKAHAVCNYTGALDGITVYADANLTLSSNQPVGTPLGEWSTVSTNPATLNCAPASNLQLTWRLQAGNPTAMTYTEGGQTYTVYAIPTAPGVGYVLAGAVKTENGDSPWIPLNSTGNVFFAGTAARATVDARVRFVLTGTLNPGRYPFALPPPGLVFVADTTGGSQVPPLAMYVSLQQGGNLIVPAPTCSLSIADATFDMGTLKTTDFTGGTGSTQAWVADQSLISGGCTASTVSMTFAGTADPVYSNAFANTGTAKGVALELWKSGANEQAIPNSSTPITFPAQGAGGKYTFSARYIQTEQTVTAGSVDATVTVTVDYK